MLMSDIVSVIVLTWNRSHLLKETIDSILNQSYENFELLIIDNESTDETEDYAKTLTDPRISYFKNKNNGVLAVNRNFAISKAKGAYIAFCDDDDLWEQTKLEKQMEFIKNNPSFCVVGTNGLYFNEEGTIGRLINRRTSGEIRTEDFLKIKNDIIMSSSVYKSEIFNEYAFNTDPNILSIEDYELLIRVSKKWKIYFIHMPLVRYRVHDSMTSSPDFRVQINKIKSMLKNLHDSNCIALNEYEIAMSNAKKSYRLAAIKYQFKKSKKIKSFVLSAKKRLNDQPE